MLRSSSICASFVYNYLISSSECMSKDGKPLDKNVQKLRCLTDTLASYGGVLSKLSQMLSLNDENSSVFSECKPFSQKKTIKYFQNFIEKSQEKLDSVDFNVYKSGSVGQVHRAIYKGSDIIFKVQYVGLYNQTIKDLKMLDTITSYIYYFSDMKNAMVDIKTEMYEELDYTIEKKNQEKMWEFYNNNKSIEIPQTINELCTDKILAMKFVKGRCLRDFIENSTQSERNKLAICLLKFIFENIYKNGILYSDVHYGNFLVKDDCTLCVLDFGCVHYIDDKLTNHLQNLHISIKDKNKDDFYRIVEEIGIINKNISELSKIYIYEYFRLQYEPWISEDFEFTEEWLDKSTNKDTELMKEWILPQNMVYFNKIPYGMYHILTKLKLKGNFSQVFSNIFEEIRENS